MTTSIDLMFPAMGTFLPTDHAYALYAALSRLLPPLHDGRLCFGMAPITGPHVGNGRLQIDSRQSRLRLRLPAADIAHVLPLAGKALDIAGHRIRLGVPELHALPPTPALIARTVTFKDATDADHLLKAARQQLDKAGIGGQPRVPEHLDREGRPEPIRRVVRVKGVRIVGYSLLVEGLGPEESLKLQEVGLGGRRHLGCGLFIPARREGNVNEG